MLVTEIQDCGLVSNSKNNMQNDWKLCLKSLIWIILSSLIIIFSLSQKQIKYSLFKRFQNVKPVE